jgi:hypothetical protein
MSVMGMARDWYQRDHEKRVAETQAMMLERYGAPAPVRAERQPLTASQHILHLLLTVFTCGLWAPVWFWRSCQGNRSR